MVNSKSLALDTRGNGDMIDVTDAAVRFVRESGLRNGLLTVFVPGATAGVTTIEFENGLVKDFADLMERLAPEKRDYAHNARWGDGNGHSHLRASLVGPSLSVPVRDADLTLGMWQQIVVVDFDNRPRRRNIILQAIGD